jgi:hypothetical protein
MTKMARHVPYNERYNNVVQPERILSQELNASRRELEPQPDLSLKFANAMFVERTQGKQMDPSYLNYIPSRVVHHTIKEISNPNRAYFPPMDYTNIDKPQSSRQLKTNYYSPYPSIQELQNKKKFTS